MKKTIFISLLFCFIVCCHQVCFAKNEQIVFDSEAMTLTYLSNELEFKESGNLFLATYDNDRLIDVSSEQVSAGDCSVSISASVTDIPDKVKVFTWNEELRPIDEAIIKEISSSVINSIELVDFAIEVGKNKEPVILQLTDTQIIDAAQKRYPSRLGAAQDVYWATDKTEERCYGYIREIIEATNPDLILLTGDVIYGEFDDNGTALQGFIEFMDSFDIPWAPVFGNHDNESTKGVDWQCEQLVNAENCLFKQRTLTGNGNYTVGIMQNGVLKRVFFMLDSNGCSSMSSATAANGHSSTAIGFGDDQIEWYTETAEKIKVASPDTKITFAFHIQPLIFKTAYAKYGFTNSGTIDKPINIDLIETAADSDFGYLGRDLKGAWDSDFSVYNGIKALGTDSILVGHEHCNSASVVYDGIRFQYGQKTSTYDRANYISDAGEIYGSHYSTDTPIMGGTVMKLSEADGAITDAYIYYCGGIDTTPPLEVNGLGIANGKLMPDDNIRVDTENIAGKNAYKFTADEQGKIYVNTALFANKDTFTFSVFLPEKSTKKLDGYGEFAININPETIEPDIDGSVDGYINYSSSATVGNLKLVHEKWKTYTVDISEFKDCCTEFSFVVPAGNTIYLRDLILSGNVNGFGLANGELTTDGNISIDTENIVGEDAYKFTAETHQGEVYVNTDLLANKGIFTFSIFLPEESTSKLAGYGEFAIRIKPGSIESDIDGNVDGYINYSSSATAENLKLVHGEWKTYTIDISRFKDSCEGFSFVVAAGNTIYLRDLAVIEGVNGLGIYNGELTAAACISVVTESIAGENAYKFTADEQGKIYVNTALLANKDTFTFSVFLPEESTAKLAGYGEFAIRIKPNTIEPEMDGRIDGYINYNTAAGPKSFKLVRGEWKTYTVDVSEFKDLCTEFSFVLAKGNTIYLKDMSVS